MSPEQIVAYLRGWAKLHTQEVYGSSREFININSLNAELDRIEDNE